MLSILISLTYLFLNERPAIHLDGSLRNYDVESILKLRERDDDASKRWLIDMIERGHVRISPPDKKTHYKDRFRTHPIAHHKDRLRNWMHFVPMDAVKQDDLPRDIFSYLSVDKETHSRYWAT